MATQTIADRPLKSTPRLGRLQMLLERLRRATQPSPDITDPEARRRARLTSSMSLALAVILTIAFVISMFTSIAFPDPTISLGVTGTLFVLIDALGFWYAYAVSRTIRYRVGVWITILMVYVVLTGFSVLYPALANTLMIGYTAPVLFATILLSSGGTIRVFLYSIMLTMLNLIFQGVTAVSFAFTFAIVLVITVLTVLVSLLREEDLIQVQRLHKLEAQEAERLRRELDLARKVQQAMLPRSLPDVPSLDLAAYSQPAFEASGDFYDVFSLNHGAEGQPKLGIVVCDVAGKGVSSALVMSATRAALRAEAESVTSPAKVLRKVNEMLAHSIPNGLFVTLFYGVYDPALRQLRFASAGHPHPYWWRGEQISELQNYGMPLGLTAESEYEDQVAELAPGDSVFIYTDGLVEALNPRREMFGFENVERKVAIYAQQRMSAKDLLNCTLQDMEAFAEGERPHDDVTIVALRVKEIASSAAN